MSKSNDKRKYTRNDIDLMLKSFDSAVERGIVALYRLQTADEQASDVTRHDNNRGFNAPSARKGSYFARWVLSGNRLTGSHLEKARAICLRHSRQLVAIANGESVE